jgi:hypothetical protein
VDAGQLAGPPRLAKAGIPILIEPQPVAVNRLQSILAAPLPGGWGVAWRLTPPYGRHHVVNP